MDKQTELTVSSQLDQKTTNTLTKHLPLPRTTTGAVIGDVIGDHETPLLEIAKPENETPFPVSNLETGDTLHFSFPNVTGNNIFRVSVIEVGPTRQVLLAVTPSSHHPPSPLSMLIGNSVDMVDADSQYTDKWWQFETDSINVGSILKLRNNQSGQIIRSSDEIIGFSVSRVFIVPKVYSDGYDSKQNRKEAEIKNKLHHRADDWPWKGEDCSVYETSESFKTLVGKPLPYDLSAAISLRRQRSRNYLGGPWNIDRYPFVIDKQTHQLRFYQYHEIVERVKKEPGIIDSQRLPIGIVTMADTYDGMTSGDPTLELESSLNGKSFGKIFINGIAIADSFTDLIMTRIKDKTK